MANDFDYVIVGAGSAGCVLANRLSANRNTRVLLLEAGGWDWSPLISIPVGARILSRHHLYEWGDESEPDPGLNGRRMHVPHGQVVGGTSSINFMACVRGNPADYARWVALGARGWSYEEVLPFFRQCETWAGGADAYRGDRGEMGIRAPTTSDGISGAFIEAAREVGCAVTPDYNGAQNEGFGPIQYSLRRGRRSSAAAAFLRPVLRRPNLTVRTGAQATRVLFEGRRAVGLEYLYRGRPCTLRTSGRIVLSLGAINTPHLLMLSGVGPADHLRKTGIAPVADLPVGDGLEDHLGTLVMWTRPTPGAFHRTMRLDRTALNMVRAIVGRDGPAAELPAGVLGFVRTREGLAQPDLQVIIPSSAPNADVWFPAWRKPYVDGFMIRAQLVAQKSRGTVRLRSADPAERPSITYNSLSEADDLRTLREGVRLTLAIGESTALAPYRAQRVLPAADLSTDEEIDAFVRQTAIQLYHPAATCRMGSGPEAVLNPDLSVRGLEGLYVVDASAMPKLVSGNPQVVISMMAARAAALWRGGAPSV